VEGFKTNSPSLKKKDLSPIKNDLGSIVNGAK
jgi:hypothetical protein